MRTIAQISSASGPRRASGTHHGALDAHLVELLLVLRSRLGRVVRHEEDLGAAGRSARVEVGRLKGTHALAERAQVQERGQDAIKQVVALPNHAVAAAMSLSARAHRSGSSGGDVLEQDRVEAVDERLELGPGGECCCCAHVEGLGSGGWWPRDATPVSPCIGSPSSAHRLREVHDDSSQQVSKMNSVQQYPGVIDSDCCWCFAENTSLAMQVAREKQRTQKPAHDPGTSADRHCSSKVKVIPQTTNSST